MDKNLNNALKAHELYWSSYINGQADVVESLLDENYQQIGSVEEEVFFNKRDAVTFVKKTIDQIAGKVELRNRVTKSEKLSGYILINEFFDLYVKTDDNWSFYAKFRTSSLMQQKADGWKLVHQHSSLPDSKTEEGENIAIDKINKENLELKNAIKRRTVELEHKNRELEIEAALERVRAKAMAMRRSDELTDAAVVLFHELNKLGIAPRRCGFAIKQQDAPAWQFWHTTKDGQAIEKVGRLTEAQVPFFGDVFTAWKDGKAASHTSTFSGTELEHAIHFLIERTEVKLPDAETEVQQGIYPTQICFNFFFFKHGSLLAHSLHPLKEENRKVLERFARIFEQTYTRFLDLQKAEAQAREAQIEAALERVRSRTMAMQKSDELLEVIAVIAEQLKYLDFRYDNVSFAVKNQAHDYKFWLTAPGLPEPLHIHIPYIDNPMFERLRDIQDNNLDIYTDIISIKDNRQWHQHVFDHSVLQNLPENTKTYILENGYARTIIMMPTIMLIIGNYVSKPYTEDENNVFKRFAGVFEQSYTRFLDLQKAEAQAREARIETSLEKIRARALGMQSPDELGIIVGHIYQELTLLDLNLDRAFIQIFDPQTLDVTWWMAGNENPLIHKGYRVQHSDFPLQLAYVKGWRKLAERWEYILEGEEKKAWDEYIFSDTELANLPEVSKDTMKAIERAFVSASFAGFGCITLGSIEPLPEDSFDILQRFTRVFDFAYTRFLDLQKAEAQARETQIETALERIRAKALSMHQSDELMEVALTLREQMGLLGQKEMEASVIQFYNLKKNTIQSWHVLNTPGLEKGDLSSGSFEIRKNANQLTQQFFTEFESEKTEYSFAVEGEVLWEWLEYLSSNSPEIKESLDGFKPEKAYFHFSKFTDGALLMVSSTPPTEESKYLQKRAAQVFELAYKRYLDLQQAEKLAEKAKHDMIRLKVEKEKTEEALKELEATQAQLVQQEKLASLGQLTAGIAHEIKNPLNFVNNFSEVSMELVEEAREEVKRVTEDRGPKNSLRQPTGSAEVERKRGVHDKAGSRDLSQYTQTDSSFGNTPLNPLSRGEDGSSPAKVIILEILDDIESNLKKIHEHGSRADGIVKSMLQHSRGGSGKIQPTGLNALVKEYVNLSYHGMRAGKKPFSVDIVLQMDNNIGEVPLIAEDFSRVILNICNNAFDAMREKLTGDGGRETGESYTPKLAVRTHQKGKAVTIEIEDNGPGVPDEMKDKILQPFFTTKKGTEGTGLGLSITHDIIKAHGGDISIESVVNTGSTFVIKLPHQPKTP